MSHEPRAPAVARPLARVVTGGREEAVALEEALRRHFAAGLERLADDGTDDPRAALEALEHDAGEVLERGGGEAPSPPISWSQTMISEPFTEFPKRRIKHLMPLSNW